jgi:Lrp/AsnC family transcriptional regulator for asnA, asnC and gidA
MSEFMNSAIDDLDLEILKHLQTDGRKSFTDIATDLGVAVGTVRNRVTRLIDEGVLHIFGRVIPHKVGFNAPVTLFISVDPPSIDAAVQELMQFPEVSYLALITGDFDLMVDLMCRDVDHLTELITKRLSKIPGMRKTRTAFILKIVKYAQPDLNLIKSSPQHEEDVVSHILR